MKKLVPISLLALAQKVRDRSLDRAVSVLWRSGIAGEKIDAIWDRVEEQAKDSGPLSNEVLSEIVLEYTNDFREVSDPVRTSADRLAKLVDEMVVETVGYGRPYTKEERREKIEELAGAARAVRDALRAPFTPEEIERMRKRAIRDGAKMENFALTPYAVPSTRPFDSDLRQAAIDALEAFGTLIGESFARVNPELLSQVSGVHLKLQRALGVEWPRKE
jgi:Xaa-Pro aminopeptidase